MTEIIVAFVPFLAAVAFFIRARGELKGRRAAERRAAELDRALQRRDAYQREWLGTLAHELRTPLGAIVGYGELLGDGTFGPLDERGIDITTRIRAVADQALGLVDGIDRFADAGPRPDDVPGHVPALAALRDAADALAVDAESRGVELHVDDVDVDLATRPADLRRVVRLALAAAIKASPGARILLSAEDGPTPAVALLHTRLDPLHDDPDRSAENTADGGSPDISGAAIRIGMARLIAESALAGRVLLTATPDGCAVRIELPRLAE